MNRGPRVSRPAAATTRPSATTDQRLLDQGSLLREGALVVLAGLPNAGKSSLLNRLAGEEVAIVAELPGTTRDAIRQSINLFGVPVHIIDTAGLRESSDPVERIGIARTWSAIEKADLTVLVIDATKGESEEDRTILSRLPKVSQKKILRLHLLLTKAKPPNSNGSGSQPYTFGITADNSTISKPCWATMVGTGYKSQHQDVRETTLTALSW